MKTSFSLSICVASFLLLVTGCGTARHVSVDNSKDSTRVEIRTEYVERLDTVYVEIPKIVEKVTTRDTVSRLENEYARSVAEIQAGGYLYHTLETKAEKRPVTVIAKESVRDSIVYRDKEVYIETPVEVEKPKTWFQNLQSIVFWVVVVLVLVWLALKLRKLFAI